MVFPERDPNRYAGELEAAGVRARLAAQDAELRVLRQNHELAQRASAEAQARVRQMQEQLNMISHLRDDAAAFEADLQRRLDAQTAAMTTNRGLLHPVRKLPLELLGEIFECCVDGIPDEIWDHERWLYDNDICARQLQPFQLAGVCRRWRTASCAAPRAWSQVALLLDAVSEQTFPLWRAFLETVLHRSRAAPLCILIVRERDSPPFHGALVSMLADAMSRCYFLGVTVEDFEPIDALLPVLGSRSPQLVEASLSARSAALDSLGGLRLLPGAYNLRRLSLCNMSRNRPTAFPSLASLSLIYPVCRAKQDDIPYFLQNSPLLKHMVIELPIIFRKFQPTKIVARALTHLGLIVFDRQPVQHLADMVELPELSTLHLQGFKYSAGNLLAFLSKLAPTSPQLSRLTFESSGSGEAHFANFLTILPLLGALAVLKFDGAPMWEITKRDLHLLCSTLDHPRADGSWICTQLASIEFGSRCVFAEDCDPEDIYRLVQKRLTAYDERDERDVASLSTFTVAGWPNNTRAAVQVRINTLIECIDFKYLFQDRRAG